MSIALALATVFSICHLHNLGMFLSLKLKLGEPSAVSTNVLNG